MKRSFKVTIDLDTHVTDLEHKELLDSLADYLRVWRDGLKNKYKPNN